MAQEFKEKTITINLSKVFEKPVTKRAISAKNMLKAAVQKETRLKEVSVSNKVNEEMWGRGKYNAPRKITIKIINEKGRAIILMPNEKYEPQQDKKKETKKGETKKEEKETVKEKTKISETKEKEIKTESKAKPKEETK